MIALLAAIACTVTPSSEAEWAAEVDPGVQLIGPNLVAYAVIDHGSEEAAAAFDVHRPPHISVEVRDAQGELLHDPDHRPTPFAINGMVAAPTPAVRSGTSSRVAVGLSRNAWFEKAGTYDVRLRPEGATEWVQTQITVRMPTPPEALDIVEAMHPHSSDAEGLGHPVYVPILEYFARTMTSVESTNGWEMAFQGLFGCPCPESTDALLRLYAVAESTDLRSRIRTELAWRKPQDPHRPDSPSFLRPEERERIAWFAARSWSDSPAGGRGVAREILQRPISGGDGEPHYGFAADLLSRVGTAEDVPLLTSAMERVAIADRDQVRGLMGTLFRAANALGQQPVDDPSSGVAALLALRGWSGEGKPPLGWEDRLAVALDHDNPVIVEAALQLVPSEPSEATIERVGQLLLSEDRPLAIDAGRCVERLADRRFQPAVLRAVASGWNMGWAVSAAEKIGTPEAEVVAALRERARREPDNEHVEPLIRRFDRP